jgi:hypothetical protein
MLELQRLHVMHADITVTFSESDTNATVRDKLIYHLMNTTLAAHILKMQMSLSGMKLHLFT